MVVRWSGLAKETLLEILQYIERDFGVFVSQSVYERIMNHVRLLASFPFIGRVDDVHVHLEKQVRYIVCEQSLVYYLIEEDVVLIIAVFDVRRSPQTVEHIITDFLRRR